MNAAQYYQANVGLVHMVSKKGYARLQKAGVAIDYDDVFQEMSIVFLKAYEKFDAERGFKFSTYFCMAAINRTNGWAQGLIEERLKHGVVSIQEMSSNQGEDYDAEEVLMVDPATPEAHYRVTEFLEHIAKSLSPLAALIVAWMAQPPQEMIVELRKAEAYALYGRQRGFNSRCMATISPRYVANFIRMISDVSTTEAERALKEIDRLRYSDAKKYLGA